MTHNVLITTRDGEEISFACASGQNLVDAAQAAGMTLPAQCRQGSCGACHATVTGGEYEFGEHNPEALPAGAGGILMCRTAPLGDLRIAVPYERSRILFQTVRERSAQIVAVEPVSESTARLELRLDSDEDGGNAAEFEPGQFMELGIPGTDVRRAYSLANTANWEGRLEFLIRLHPDGRFSGFLRQALPGDKVGVRGPLGAFGIEAGSLRPRWFVAGGTGLAPMLAMLRRMAEFQETNEARLFFGVNRESELFALAELERLKMELPQLRVDVCVWQPAADWRGFAGTPAEALAKALDASQASPDIYLCGPPPMIDAAMRAIAEAGIPATQVFSERFLPG